MTRLVIEEYCDGCEFIEPVVDGFDKDFIISCKNEKMCRKIYKNIKKQFMEKEKNGN